VKIIIIGDIHSNCFALESVLKDIDKESPDLILNLGDTFGYYPWAVEVWQQLESVKYETHHLLGNHDALVAAQIPPDPEPVYYKQAKQNRDQLLKYAPKALDHLNTLNYSAEWEIDGFDFHGFHGTPQNPANGRFYPDDAEVKDWFPIKERSLVLLGHTHYPLFIQTGTSSGVLNPGSVGQPRDGNVNASWVVWDTDSEAVEFRRTIYPLKKAVSLLKEMHWDERSVLSLEKDKPGELR